MGSGCAYSSTTLWVGVHGLLYRLNPYLSRFKAVWTYFTNLAYGRAGVNLFSDSSHGALYSPYYIETELESQRNPAQPVDEKSRSAIEGIQRMASQNHTIVNRDSKDHVYWLAFICSHFSSMSVGCSYQFFSIFSHIFNYLRSFPFSFSLPSRCNSDPGSLD